jgi:large subunit ribosomal protein L4
MKVKVFSQDGKVQGDLDLSDEVFGGEVNEHLLYLVIKSLRANQRQGTAKTKTRAEVSGGGKKPWKQKHTGRARAGSIRSPLWRGGGTVFGPQPRDYSFKLPKKVKRLALMSAFHEKLSSGEVMIIDTLSVEKPKTKEMIAILKGLGLNNKSVLIILPEKDDAITLSARNIPGVAVTRAMDLNTYDILAYNMLLMTKEGASRLEEIKGS